MAPLEDKDHSEFYQGILLEDPDFLKGIVTRVLQQTLEAEASFRLGAESYERVDTRKGYRNGSYSRTLKTRVGQIELSVPRDRDGVFQTRLFRRYQRSEKSFILSLMEMSLQGVSTRKVSKITEELCGTSFSRSFVSSLSKDLDEQLHAWRNRSLRGRWPYLYVDALYEKVRINSRVCSRAVLIVLGVNETGRRSILSVDVCNSENSSDYGDLFRQLRDRGLTGVELVISDDHQGLVNSVERYFQGTSWQRCQVHFMRNFVKKLGKKDRVRILGSLKDVFNAQDRNQAESRLRLLLDDIGNVYPDLCEWLEDNIQDAFAVYNFPPQHFRRIRSTNGLERLNEEIRRRTRVIRIFPNRESCLRMASALCQEQDEEWSTGKSYLDMSLLSINRKQGKSENILQAV